MKRKGGVHRTVLELGSRKNTDACFLLSFLYALLIELEHIDYR